MIITVRVKPNAKTTRMIDVVDHRMCTIALHAPATEGKANDELIEYFANALNIAKSTISIVKGHASKTKRVELPDGVDVSRLST